MRMRLAAPEKFLDAKDHFIEMPTEFTVTNVVNPKTCSRCGRTFGAPGRQYVCHHCKNSTARTRFLQTQLSPREKQIVQLVQQAKTNKEIAYDLCLTTGTIKEYLYHIFRKLCVTNRTELALRAREPQHVASPLKA
jgi:DNA-binding NarL/FixJ family response regulator